MTLLRETILFFAGRGADILTTWLNVHRWGYGVEASPFGRGSMERYGFAGYLLLNLAVSTMIFLAIKYLKRRWLMRVALASFYGVAVWNLAVYLLIT